MVPRRAQRRQRQRAVDPGGEGRGEGVRRHLQDQAPPAWSAQADLYHILPRPDGRKWDGIEYYDPAAGKGVVYLFKPSPRAGHADDPVERGWMPSRGTASASRTAPSRRPSGSPRS